MSDERDDKRQVNRSLFTRLAVIAVGMFAFGYALVPFTTRSAR
jgi:cytochrome c oxidase assembly protein Cox11